MFSRGVFKTRMGLPAIVARCFSGGGVAWQMKGAVKFNNVYFFARWDQYGKNSENSDYDLVEKIS